MNICVIGTGYVGLTTAVGFASLGNTVYNVGRKREKIDMINSGVCPIYEPGMNEKLKKCIENGSLFATGNLKEAIQKAEITFICVGTPSREDGSIDLSDIEKVSADIGSCLKEKEYHVVAVKSTVVPGTTEKNVIPNLEGFSGKSAGSEFGVCMIPEFLREGVAMEDFMKPDRIVIGEFDKKSGDVAAELYNKFDSPILRTDLQTAEMIKYASNSMLATKISFANEIGNICKRLGIDTYKVMEGAGLDRRIGPHFLNSGCGFGGSCFPKDVAALISKAREIGYEPRLLTTVMEINKRQKARMVEMLKEKTGELKGKRIAVLGLAFKDNTDDIREAPSIEAIKALKSEGAYVVGYDPKAAGNMKRVFPDIEYADSAREALKNADGCLIMTEWQEFENLKNEDFDNMRNRIIIEGRRVLKGIKDAEGICW